MCTVSTARAINQSTVICAPIRSTFIKALLVFTSSALLLACSPSESDLAQADINNENTQAVTTAWEPTPENLFVFVKTQTPIAELQAYAKEMALKRSELRLAKNDPAARAQYLQAHQHLADKRFAEAEALFIRLAEQGYADVQKDLSIFYDTVFSDKPQKYQDEKKSLYWLKQAVAQGFANAQYSYALMYYSKGYPVERDWGKYADWLIIAAEQGNANAQRELGSAYSKGRGLERNLIEAYKWYGLAIRRFNPPPKDNAKNTIAVRINLTRGLQQDLITEKGMTPEQVATAKRLVEEWEASHPYAYQSINDIEHIIYRRP